MEFFYVRNYLCDFWINRSFLVKRPYNIDKDVIKILAIYKI